MSKFKLTQTAAEVQDILNNFNSLKSDGKGNLTVNKDLEVDGKLKLKSLVSNTNPDGDIRNALGGGGKLYCHHIELNYSSSTGGYIAFDYYSKEQKKFNTIKQFASAFNRKRLICAGSVKVNNECYTPIQIYTQLEKLYVDYLNSSGSILQLSINDWNFDDSLYEVN